MRANVSWTFCLRNLVTTFYQGQAVLEKDMDASLPLEFLLQQLNHEQAKALLWLGQAFAEEVSRHDPRRMSRY
jgi:hypothetical protein